MMTTWATAIPTPCGWCWTWPRGSTYSANLTVEAGEGSIRVSLYPPEETETPDFDLDPDKYTIVVDAGHDGKTLGAVYPRRERYEYL